MLTISVKNFGPIAEGSVDLKPLTIFVGPSNTGKSYMATAVYTLLKTFRGDDLIPPKHRATMSRWERMGFSTRSLPWTEFWNLPDDDSEVGNAIYQWGRQLETHGEPDSLVVADMPEDVRQALEQAALKGFSKLRRDAREQFIAAFGESVNRANCGASFLISIHRDNPVLTIDFSLEDESLVFPKFDISQTEIVPSPLALTEFSNNYSLTRDGEEPILVAEIFDAWCQSVAETLTRDVPYRGFYLPAGRTGIVQGHKILVADLVRQSSSGNRHHSLSPTLPGITTEFLGNLISLDRRMRERPRIAELENAISFIERSVLQGQIDLDESAGLPYPEIAYTTKAGQFALEHSSSMVSELAPLILFLKYLVRPGDLLILEEPESHLHPAAQRQLARGIVRLVNAGVKVLITTHSDLFISQVNNLMRISFASKRWIWENGFEPQDCLKHDDVAAHLFHWDNAQDGSVVDELEIRRDVGIDDAMFGEVINAIYEESLLVQRIRPKWEQTNS